MKFVKTLLAVAALAASAAAGAQVVPGLGGGTGSFLALSGGDASGACLVGTPCRLGTIGTIVGGALRTGDANFADADAFAANGGLFGGNFLAAGPSIGAPIGQPSVLTFGTALNYISFLWGSPDTYNVLTVVSSFGTQTFRNTDFSLPGDGSQTFARYVTLTGNGITSLSFNNIPAQNAFEVANFSIVRAVPEPETYALMLAGLSALGFISRRRKRV